MARTISTGQEDILFAAKFNVHSRVEVENSTGGMVNLSALSSADWMRAVRWNWNIDQPVPQLTFDIRRDHGQSTGESLAPLDSDSTFNYNSTNGYAALVYPGRELHVYTACTTPGGPAPASSAYDFMFQGEIDEMNWEATPMTGLARSRNMGRIYDRWIQSSSYTYGNSTGVLVETVIEQILANWTNLSTSILLTPASPGFLISPAYAPEKQRVLDAITANAMLPGYTLQEVWSTASTSWRVKFSEPNRDATSSEKNWTFGADNYYDVTLMRVSREDVRNYLSGLFGPSTNRQQLIVQSTSSQDAYELQWMEFDESVNSAIATSSEMSTLLNAALGDLKEPYVTHAIELPYFYPVELGDFIEFEANGVHYSTNQYLAVVGVSHTLEPNRHRTTITCRGKPAGHRLQWLQYRGGGNLVFAEVLSADIAFDASALAVVSVVATERIATNVYITVGDGATPADPTAAANHGSLTGSRGVITSSVTVTAGKTATVKAVAADAAGILGPVVTKESARREAFFHADNTDRATSSTTQSQLGSSALVPAGALGSSGSIMVEVVAFLGAATTGGAVLNMFFGPATSAFSGLGGGTLVSSGSTGKYGVRHTAAVTRRNSTSMLLKATRTYSPYFPVSSVGPNIGYQSDTEATISRASTQDNWFWVEGYVNSTQDTLTVDWSMVYPLKST